MFEYIIVGIIIIIILAIVVLILRKRTYDKVDQFENWKIDIMNRNIASELSKIKYLNLSGEAQRKFETWKERWEQIVDKDLADIEENLFDAEEAADRYRFRKAKHILHTIEKSLAQIENDLEEMMSELDYLLQAAKDSEEEVADLYTELSSLQSLLAQNRSQFGRAEMYFEVEFDELKNQLRLYKQYVEKGEYTYAKQHVDNVSQQLETLKVQIEQFPELYKKCQEELPSQLDELLSGIREMKEDGYRVKHLEYEKNIQTFQQRLIDCVQSLEKGSMKDALHVIPEIEEEIANMYERLEEEAIAKNYIETQSPNFKHTIEELASTFTETKEEVEHLKTTYYLDDQYMEEYIALEKAVTHITNQFYEFRDQLSSEGVTHLELRNRLEKGFKQLEELQKEHEQFKNRIQMLRKDELHAKEKLAEMRRQLNDVNRKLQKSNLPGVPDFIWDTIEKAQKNMNEVMNALKRHPLDIAQVQYILNEAKISVDHAVQQTELVLEQSYLTEQVIQYANKYRSQYPHLAVQLSKAEQLFRSYEYELALEHAAKAIEEIEPGALKKIEENQKQMKLI